MAPYPFSSLHVWHGPRLSYDRRERLNTRIYQQSTIPVCSLGKQRFVSERCCTVVINRGKFPIPIIVWRTSPLASPRTAISSLLRVQASTALVPTASVTPAEPAGSRHRTSLTVPLAVGIGCFALGLLLATVVFRRRMRQRRAVSKTAGDAGPDGRRCTSTQSGCSCDVRTHRIVQETCRPSSACGASRHVSSRRRPM